MREKWLSIAIAAALFLCACGGAGMATQTAPAQQALPMPVSPVNVYDGQAAEIVFAISRDASDVLVNAARQFATEFQERTNGAVAVRVELAIAPDADLRTGRAQIALLNKRRQLEFCEPLAASATPFLYSGYNNFLMRANAGSVMSVLEFSLRENHGLVPLAAFYQGAKHLLIDFTPGGYQNYDGMTIITSENEEVRASFGRLVGTGGYTTPLDSDESRMEAFLFGEGNAAEMRFEALAEMQDGFEYQVHLITSYHDLVPVWFVACAEFTDGLSPLWRAELAELTAHMANSINDAYRSADVELLHTIREIPNLTVDFVFAHVRNHVFHTLPPLEEGAGDDKMLARDLLTIMRRTA